MQSQAGVVTPKGEVKVNGKDTKAAEQTNISTGIEREQTESESDSYFPAYTGETPALSTMDERRGTLEDAKGVLHYELLAAGKEE